MLRWRGVTIYTLTFFGLVISRAAADPLAPDDPAISGSLVSWHRDAATNYADGVWTANVGPNLIELGESGNGADFFEVPELATWTPEEGYFTGLVDVNGVLFAADVSDMLTAEELNGGEGFEELTLIGVYQTTGNSDRTRPVGIGSFTDGGGGENFNLSSDASLRFDNGNNRTDPFLHLPDLTFRAGVLSEGFVSDFLDGEIITDEEFPGGSFSGVTRNDTLFIGDLRGGTVDGFTAADLHDVFVAEVIAYNARLTEEQITGIGEWLRLNLATGTGGSEPCDFDRSGELDVADIDLLREAVRSKENDPTFDLNGDSLVNSNDIVVMIESPDKFNSYMGDSNLNGEFNSGDLVIVFGAGEYNDGIEGNSTWSTGDWNGNGDFDSGDLVSAFQGGGYNVGPRDPAAAVPEPQMAALLQIACVVLVQSVRRRRRGARR